MYYFSGGVSPSEFSFNEGDTAYHDLFTLPLLSSTVQFYSTGMEVSRLEKVEAIADWKYSQKNLQVCALDNECNCGRCGKCIRTLGELYLCDKLDLYTERFPVDDFKKHFAARFAKILVEAHKGHVFEVELVQEMKARGHKIPLKSYVLFPIYGLLEWLRIHLRENRLARKLYRKFNMDVRIYGKKTYAKHLDEEILEECDDRKV